MYLSAIINDAETTNATFAFLKRLETSERKPIHLTFLVDVAGELAREEFVTLVKAAEALMPTASK